MDIGKRYRYLDLSKLSKYLRSDKIYTMNKLKNLNWNKGLKHIYWVYLLIALTFSFIVLYDYLSDCFNHYYRYRGDTNTYRGFFQGDPTQTLWGFTLDVLSKSDINLVSKIFIIPAIMLPISYLVIKKIFWPFLRFIGRGFINK